MKSPGGICLSVRNENASGIYRKFGEPFYQVISIGVGGKTLYLGYSGVDEMLLTVNPDVFGTVKYISSQGSRCLVAGEEHGTFRS